MKKIGILLALAALLISCGEDDNGVNWDVYSLKVRSADWNTTVDDDGLNRFYYCDFNMPAITHAVYEYGTVLAYYTLDDSQQILPYVRHYEDVDGNRWTQTVDFEYSQGGLTIYVTNSDFFNERPSTMDFRVVLMW